MNKRSLAGLCLLLALPLSLAQSATPPAAPIARIELLSAMLAPPWPVGQVRSQDISLAVGVQVPLHLHPCPTFGVVREGEVAFQIEGQAVQHLKAGQAFYEPANTRIARFDNEGQAPARFTVFYLLGEGESETIRLLDPSAK